MAWFPLFIDLSNRHCLVAGGGKVALHKVQTLLSFGARVTVVANDCLPELIQLPITLLQRAVLPADTEGMELVVDATADPAAGEMLALECARKNIPLNVVDRLELCSCIFPAMLRRGPLLAAVSTGGASPMAAAWARDRLDEVLPQQIEEILEQMGALRLQAKATLGDPARRAALLGRCFAAAIEKDGPLSDRELQKLWEEEE